MERYGGVGKDESRSDPSLEWPGLGNPPSIEASLWRLGLRGGGSVGDPLPERPDEPDCIYYLRTGVCGYGSTCRFNHPRNRTPALAGLRTEGGEFPERLGQPVCQHFMRTGTCKFGATCKYHHPRGGGGGGGGQDSATPPVSLNFMGFPLRPGEKECNYFMRTGQCKFGATCRFHHPVPPGVQAPPQQPLSGGPTMYPPLQSPSVPSSQQYGMVMARPPLLPGSYVQSPYGYSVLPPGMVPYPGWNPYQASVSAIPSTGTQPSMRSSSVYGSRPLSPSAPVYQSAPSSSGVSVQEQTFPQRPEQPECQYFMRTGDCKFGSSCRFHHPMEAASTKEFTLSNLGLPLRPGAMQCAYFEEHGICKFGPACKFDHSMGSSSLTDISVAPYPLGSSSLGTLAPSASSSSDQQTELLSSSSIKPTITTTVGSETVASGVSSSSTTTTSSVCHPEPAETNKGDSASIEAKTSSQRD